MNNAARMLAEVIYAFLSESHLLPIHQIKVFDVYIGDGDAFVIVGECRRKHAGVPWTVGGPMHQLTMQVSSHRLWYHSPREVLPKLVQQLIKHEFPPLEVPSEPVLSVED